MNKITFPLTVDMQGPQVADLQAALQLFLDRRVILGDDDARRQEFVQYLQRDRANQVYGNATRELVRFFQADRQLQASGNVDEATAYAMNAVLADLGAFVQTAQEQQRLVGGQVRYESGQPFSDRIVRAFHLHERGRLRLGEDSTDIEGYYTIRYNALPGEGPVHLRVVVCDLNGRPFYESDIRPEANPVEIIDLLVPDVSNVEVTTTYQVEGRITSPVSAGISGLSVWIVDKTVGPQGDVPLAGALTNEQGEYRVTFTDSELRQRGKSQPDLQARVFKDDTFLGASDVHYNATSRETLDVLVNDEAVAELQSEYETLTTTISRHYQDNLGDLEETDDRQDITYLANKTGWDARAVALASLAEQFSAGTADARGSRGIAPVFFYALFRTGVPANETTLYQTNPQTIETIWKQAISQRVIGADLENSIPQALEQFQQQAATHLLDAPALTGLSSLKEILSISLGDDADRHRRFAKIRVRHGSNVTEFWDAVRAEFGEEGEKIEKRLKLDGNLAYLTLNNAALIRKLHDRIGLTDPLNLVEAGYYHAEQWQKIIGDDPIPPEIPGKDAAEKRDRYSKLQAAQLRLSYPTAVVAQMVKSGDTPLSASGLRNDVSEFLTDHQGKFEIGMQPVEQYIVQNKLQGSAQVSDNVTREITGIQRVYQITPNDEAMNALLARGVDSAYAVVRYAQKDFVQLFRDDVGGETNAQLIYAKAQQVHNTALNIAISYLTASNAPGIGVHSPEQVISPTPTGANPNASDVIAYPTLEGLFGDMDYCTCKHCRSILSPAAYLVDLLLFIDRDPTVWSDFKDKWKKDHSDAPYPFTNQDAWKSYRNDWARNTYQKDWDNLNPNDQKKLPNTEIPPLDVLLSRRPDIQHLPLTCDNTNIPLPYIDLVNETLEYYVTNNHSLANPDYQGHNTEPTVTSEELLANPQFVSDKAYETLAGKTTQAVNPPPLLPPTDLLPFHQPLENLRRYFDKFEAPLPSVMESLRKGDNLERGASEYGWRDILMEELRLSRAEYKFLTVSAKTNNNRDAKLTVRQLYGYSHSSQNFPDAQMLSDLSNAKKFTRRVGITYEELIEILKTRFVNPNSTLIPKLERLGVPFSTLQAFKQNQMSGAAFDAALAPQLDASQYGGDIKAWVKNDANYANIMSLLTLTNPNATSPSDVCSFEKLKFRYANPDDIAKEVRAFEFVRLIRFIRLWKKLGWSIEQTDKAMTALYPSNQIPSTANDAIDLQRLDRGFLTLLPRLGIIKRVMRKLNLKPQKDLLPLLACFASIDTHGKASLYRQIFLSPAVLQQGQDSVFADDGYGNFLQTFEVSYSHPQPTLEPPILNAAPNQIAYDRSRKRLSYQGVLTATTRNALKTVPGVSIAFRAAIDALYASQRLFSQKETLRAAFQLTDSELSQIFTDLKYNANTPLTVNKISAIFRRGWLARKLKLSVQEFLQLTQRTAIDPFAVPDLAKPQILQFIKLVNRLRTASLKPTEALYLIWNQDLSGKSAPADSEISEFARTLRANFAAIDSEFSLTDDPEGTIAQARMALVYGNDATDLFFGLLNNSLVTSVSYSHGQTNLLTKVPYTHGQVNLLTWVSYSHPQATLEQAILNVAPGLIAYDNALKRLSFNGTLTPAIRDALKAVAGVTDAFKVAVDNLYAENQKVIQANLEQPIVNAASGLIAYDGALKQLSFNGTLTPAIRDALKTVPGITDTFKAAMDSLYSENQKVIQANLEQPIVNAAPGLITYDDLRKQLSCWGVLTEKNRDDLKATAASTLSPQAKIDQFQDAVDKLYVENQNIIAPFFTRYPELETLYDAYYFFGRLSSSVEYTQALDPAIQNIAQGRLIYDPNRGQLTWSGVLSATIRDALTAGASQSFQAAINGLYTDNQTTQIQAFFANHPTLAGQQAAYLAADNIPEKMRSVLLASFLPELENRRKRQQALQAISAAANTEFVFATALLDDVTVLHAAALNLIPKGNLSLTREKHGLSADYFFRSTATGNVDRTSDTEANLNYDATSSNRFPINPAAGNPPISGIWSGYLEVPEDGFYTFSIEADGGATITQTLGGVALVLVQNGNTWITNTPIELCSGMLYAISLKVEGVKDTLKIRWSANNRNLGIIQSCYLYPSTRVRPAVDDLTLLARLGLSVQFFFRDTATGAVDQARDAEPTLSYAAAGSNKLPTNPNPANAISGIWSGCLEAPENGFYNLQIETDAGAVVTLTLGGTAITLTQNGGTNWSNSTPIELRAGKLYTFSLVVEKVKANLVVHWQTAGRGWEVIPSRYLYSETLSQHLRQVYVRFLKATALATALDLTAAEIAYLAAHSDYHIDGQGWLNSLPVTGSPNPVLSTALLKSLNALLDFAHLKADLAPNDERLLAVLKDPKALTDNQDSQLLTLTRWETDSLNSLLIRFGKVIGGNPDQDALKTLSTFSRVYDAYVWVKQLGVSAAALIAATTNEPTAAVVRDFQDALRARYAQSDWLAVLKPINDEMRGLQRDALVAYILHQMRSSSNQQSQNIDTPEKLFEYFLMDVQMEPCMQTSRIRHALSSVQLFIERCLMNLEPRVAAATINAKQWEWMKRYRVWEANRKVFLYPENWLEPELRDDQSPFFKETMSELLQGDITEDRAATALLNYLSKLDEVAKLEPCGIHYVENTPGTDDDITYVIARTSGANRKYYYRCCEQGYWTPWEPIKLDIEDNPVVPVVWKGRLFLFWLRILKQPIDLKNQTISKDDGEGDIPRPLAHYAPSEIKENTKKDATENTKVMVQAILCWSEYYNSKWQPTRTSDVNQAQTLKNAYPAIGDGAFDRSNLRLSISEQSGNLKVSFEDLGTQLAAAFLLYNSHSLPEGVSSIPFNDRVSPSGKLGITYGTSQQSISILTEKGSQDSHTAVEARAFNPPWNAPFIYEGKQHVFYVTTSGQVPPVNQQGGILLPPIPQPYNVPPLNHHQPPIYKIFDVFDSLPMLSFTGVADPTTIDRLLLDKTNINKAIGSLGTVQFGNAAIGPSGALKNPAQLQ
jgi:hypothetical protein